MMSLIDNSLISVDLENCTLCKACVNDCVANLFYVESEKLHIVDEFEERCHKILEQEHRIFED